MSSRFARQPLKFVWTVVTIFLCCIRVPLIGLFYIPKSTRPHARWTYRQAVGNEILKLWFAYASTVEFRMPLSLDPAGEGERFITIKPSTQNIYRPVLGAPGTAVQPSIVGGTWFPRLYQPSNDARKQVVLHFHGGGYVLGGTRDSECGFAANNLFKHTGALSFFPQYRLATSPNGEFPAAFQDALTAYAYLLNDLKIPSSQIVVSGDSAGGHIAVTLLRYISENAGILPDPVAALLWSPWLNLAVDTDEFDHSRNSKTDFVPALFVKWAIRAFTKTNLDPQHPYLSPLHHPFPAGTPIWVQVGESEVLNDDIVLFVRQMKTIEQNNVELYEVPYAPHDIFLAGNILGFEKEAADAAEVAAKFLGTLNI
ncbi:MAG: hypothetical protein LQ338_008023 [Usnochroma carphineum]|nr:MAG: hypothetical protein LQ338_008023 [Usnochroma carphineum]